MCLRHDTADFFSSNGANPGGIPPSLTAAQLATVMSTTDNTADVSTFITITETFKLATASSVPLSITHDDGGTIYIDGSFACGDPAEASVNTETCSVPVSAGTHSLTVYYTEDNGAPADLVASIPKEVPEPASLAILAGWSASARRVGGVIIHNRRRLSGGISSDAASAPAKPEIAALPTRLPG